MKIEFATSTAGRVIFPLLDTSREIDDLGQHALQMNHHVALPMVFAGIFSATECASAIEIGESMPSRTGLMMGATPNCRRSRISWLTPSENTAWLYGKLASVFRAVNHWYGFELVGLVDALQYSAYDAGDAFGWHLDTGPGQTSTRKLSVSVQLTAGETYEGGNLEFCAARPLDGARELGTVIVFPSFLAHRVTPIANGRRRALVTWAHGPAFR
jgi:PKHD-type hydroxylase